MIALPTKRFVFIAAVPLGASVLLLPYFYLTGQDLPVLPILAAVNLTLFGIYLSDWLTIPLAKRFSAERDPEGVLLQLATHKIGLSVAFHKRKSRRIPVRIFDDLHPFMESKAFPLDTMLSPGKNQFHYHVSVPRRGSYDLRYVHLTVFGALRLVRKVYRLPCESTLRVYPDLRSISKLMLLSRTSRLSFMGIRRVRDLGRRH
jgi:uncharacterized protein (DUF58 family)